MGVVADVSLSGFVSKLFTLISNFWQVFGFVGTCPDLSGPIPTSSDAFQYIRMHSDECMHLADFGSFENEISFDNFMALPNF